MNRLEEVNYKFEQVKAFLREFNYDGILISTTANFAWLTAGGDIHLELDNKHGSVMVFATRDKLFLIANNNEVERIRSEALAGIETLFDVEVANWFDSEGTSKAIAKLGHGLSIAADFPLEGIPLVKSQFARLRYNLIEPELARYRWLTQHTAAAIEEAAREISVGMSEHEIEAAMSAKFLADQILPTVLMVASDERTMQFRHPIPSDKKLKKYAQLICCTERWGLTATMTRSVHFGDIPAELLKKQQAAAYVDAVFISETQPGARVGDIFNAAKAAYAQQGYPDEWQMHHQGGLTGYEQREYIAFPETDTVVEKNQAFGWNPTIQGAKSEDTILTTDAMPEIISMTDDWPTIEVEVNGTTLKRPAILVRK